VTESRSLLERPRISRRAAERAQSCTTAARSTHCPTAESAHRSGRRQHPDQGLHVDQGDYSEGPADIPTVAAGQSITFDNQDAPVDNGIWHTITAREAPCNSSTGIAYPLANGSVQFDSGELGAAGPPSSGYTTWQTPATLPPGTYTYFCRIHPFMRGAFRVVPLQ
jgi:plastocyanin